ncbi:MAG: hypothetical protein JXA00_04110 [Candidatus Thermoplasmatota archaeon]|nr:hypothetical protein [Candidatus Thermoplasmatota archaeon]
MDIQREDVVSVILTFCLLLVWYVTLVVFNAPLLSVSLLWVGMSVLSVLYFIVYKRRKRDMNLFKKRFYVSALPIYAALIFYGYNLVNAKEVSGLFRLLPIGIVGTMLLLNAGVVYWYTHKR